MSRLHQSDSSSEHESEAEVQGPQQGRHLAVDANGQLVDLGPAPGQFVSPEGLAIAQIIANMISQRGLGKGKGKGTAQPAGYSLQGHQEPTQEQNDETNDDDDDGASQQSGDVSMAAGSEEPRPVAKGKPKPKAKKAKKKAKN